MQPKPEHGQQQPRTRGRWQTVRTVVRRIWGAPHYDDYLEHCWRAGHAPRLSEREYVHQFFATRGQDVRCC